MAIPAALLDDLTDLCSNLGLAPDTVSDPLARLHTSLRTGVSSYLGLELSLAAPGGPITLTSFPPPTGTAEAVTSLCLPLAALGRPTVTMDPVSRLVVYAGRSGALVDLAADLTVALRGVPILLDEHRPSTRACGVTGLADASAVNRAVGVLMDQGYYPEDAELELARRAAQQNRSVSAYARDLTGPPGPA